MGNSMNVFVTNLDAKQCALEHCHVHRNKMLIEYAQLLSSANHLLGKGNDSMYKITHQHHPSTKWVVSDAGNYTWLYDMWSELAALYAKHRGRQHKSYEKLKDVLRPTSDSKPSFKYSMLAMPDEYKSNDIAASYQNYLRSKFAEWRSRERPMKVEFDVVPQWSVV